MVLNLVTVRPFNTLSQVAVTAPAPPPTIKLFSLPLDNSNFGTLMNHNGNINIVGDWSWPKGS